MRSAMWVCTLLALSGIGVCAEQSALAAQTDLSVTKTAPITPYKPAQPSGTDQIKTCPAKFEFHPEMDGVYTVGGSVMPPQPTHEVEATFSNEARQMAKKAGLTHFEAVSLVCLVVDTKGKPQEICVMKSAGFGLDGQTVKAVRKYRFKPATKNGVPAAVRISVEMNFKLY